MIILLILNAIGRGREREGEGGREREGGRESEDVTHCLMLA